MGKARLAAVCFNSAGDDEFNRQLDILRDLFSDEAQILEPVVLGAKIPEAEAVIFPQLLGDAYKKVAEIKKISVEELEKQTDLNAIKFFGLGKR